MSIHREPLEALLGIHKGEPCILQPEAAVPDEAEAKHLDAVEKAFDDPTKRVQHITVVDVPSNPATEDTE